MGARLEKIKIPLQKQNYMPYLFHLVSILVHLVNITVYIFE